MVLGLAACEEQRFEPPPAGERVAAASALYSPALFDTVRWPGQRARLLAGNDLYAARCRKCHGYLGAGDTEYAGEEQLAVPSLVEPDWEYAGKVEAVRRRIFVGHERGMPSWVLSGLEPREIDAVAYYVLYRLRPDAAAARTGRPPT
ncbi:MAG: c-type cytochrome [Gemmatimonadetes bacterium]|nr:c-type cytochrome [Gemmatimonadota bacterium]